ncbi:PIG-L deacetylase family protein [uncultured Thermanaerothrix sp.]|uniref:PIG-L deacetylase family protein n=1 Tax=uncultured Thermanaerothrix sp. TaxID=1195149 RepID=UPI00260341D9|nr:PIG-L deacetylase family protein [uncultured Thermanaerothrix sp.]
MNKAMDKPRLLAVLAHPDDETFGIGGTLAYYARRGVEVFLICATRGEAGDVSPEFLQGYGSVAERREAELRCAAGKLGLAGVYFLDYRDSGMPGSADNRHPRALINAPLEEVARKIAAVIRRLRPQVVVTFDPIGGYRHPDHIAIHQATVRAFDVAAQPDPELEVQAGPPYRPAKLYFHIIPRTLLRLTVRWLQLTGRDPHRFGRNKDIDLAAIAEVEFPTDAVVNYAEVATIRDEAAICHASQGGSGLTGGWLGRLFRRWVARETFMRAYPPHTNGRVEHDLFEGIASLEPLRKV